MIFVIGHRDERCGEEVHDDRCCSAGSVDSGGEGGDIKGCTVVSFRTFAVHFT